MFSHARHKVTRNREGNLNTECEFGWLRHPEHQLLSNFWRGGKTTEVRRSHIKSVLRHARKLDSRVCRWNSCNKKSSQEIKRTQGVDTKKASWTVWLAASSSRKKTDHDSHLLRILDSRLLNTPLATRILLVLPLPTYCTWIHCSWCQSWSVLFNSIQEVALCWPPRRGAAVSFTGDCEMPICPRPRLTQFKSCAAERTTEDPIAEDVTCAVVQPSSPRRTSLDSCPAVQTLGGRMRAFPSPSTLRNVPPKKKIYVKNWPLWMLNTQCRWQHDVSKFTPSWFKLFHTSCCGTEHHPQATPSHCSRSWTSSAIELSCQGPPTKRLHNAT